jgi:hypothetical protein
MVLKPIDPFPRFRKITTSSTHKYPKNNQKYPPHNATKTSPPKTKTESSPTYPTTGTLPTTIPQKDEPQNTITLEPAYLAVFAVIAVVLSVGLIVVAKQKQGKSSVH